MFVAISEEAFEAVDADKDGMITKEETQQLVKQLELKLEDSDIEKLFAPQQEEGENKDKVRQPFIPITWPFCEAAGSHLVL